MSQITARDALSEAVRYWEPRRILYNCVLLVVVAAVYCGNLPKARFDLTFNTVQGLFVLAVLANSCLLCIICGRCRRAVNQL